MMRKNNQEKLMRLQVRKKKPNNGEKRNRFLVIVNVVGSAGPLKFVVNEKDLVANVIKTALKTFAHEGRLPVLGFEVDNFLLYATSGGSQGEAIGSQGGRNFVLCKKEMNPQGSSEMVSHHQKGWKAWLNKSFTSKILKLT